MILKKESSVLGYPGEISKPLDANHNQICKFDSLKSPNYVAVRDILKYLLERGIKKWHSWDSPCVADLKVALGVSDSPVEDYNFFRDKCAPGTNGWILHNETFLDWREGASKHCILWLSGAPVAGKSVMASSIINDLAQAGDLCQYYFFRYADQGRRGIAGLLRSLAFQISLFLPVLAKGILEQVDESLELNTANARTVWDSIFKGILFHLENQNGPLYWIIDGVDESDDPATLTRFLAELSHCKTPIRVLLVSRDNLEGEKTIQKLSNVMELQKLSLHDRQNCDLHHYISHETQVAGSGDFKKEFTQRLLNGAGQNFLVSHKFHNDL